MDNQLKVNHSWQMHRAKLFSFWYYPDQEFLFKDGCGVLRGHNGSGKSVTTQSLITVLLDGDVRANKLDPFKSRERNISDTVLGEEGLLGIHERIGYLLLEFKKENQEVYKTIGMGIDARRGKAQNKIWYFIVDHKRFGNDEGFLKLYKEEIIEGELKKIPLSENELKKLIEEEHPCGKIYNNRKDYADKVNKHLFGFDTAESFNGLIKLLTEIRSPKLSDTTKPEGVAEVINDSLPQLTEAELRPLTDSIESIDRIEKDLRDTKKDLKAMERLNQSFVHYNQVSLVEKAVEYRKSGQLLSKLKEEVSNNEKEHYKKKQRLTEIASEKLRLENLSAVKKEELSALNVKDIEEIEERKQQAEQDLAYWHKACSDADGKMEDAVTKKLAVNQKRMEIEGEHQKHHKAFHSFIEELNHTALEMDFSKHDTFKSHLSDNSDNHSYSFHAWITEMKQYGDFLRKTKSKLEVYEKKQEELARIDDSLGVVQMDIDKEQELINAANRNIEAEMINLYESIQSWIDHSAELNLDEETKNVLVETLDEVFERLTKVDYFKPLNSLYERRQEENNNKQNELKYELHSFKEKINILHGQIDEWEHKKEVTPDFAERKEKEWNELSRAGIPFTPFYEAFEFKDSIEEDEAFSFQNALAETGILATVIVAPGDVEAAKKYTTVLEYGKPCQSNLTDVLKASQNTAYEDVLKSISVEEDEGTYILADGIFQNGKTAGKASRMEDFIVIGSAAREKIRQEKIAQYQIELEDMQLKADDKEKELRNTQMEAVKQTEQYNQFPGLGTIEGFYSEIEKSKLRIREVFEPQQKKLHDSYSEIDEAGKKLMQELKAGMDFSALTLSVSAFNIELQHQQEYMDFLRDLENAFTRKMHAKSNMDHYKELYEEYVAQEDEYRSEFFDSEAKKEKSQSLVKTFENRLKEMGSENIRSRITELKQEIDVTIPGKVNAFVEETVNTNRDLEQIERSIYSVREVELPFRKAVYDSWEKEFAEHFNFGYIDLDKEETLLDTAKSVEDDFGHLIDQKREKIETAKNKLTKIFNEQNVELFHFDLEMQLTKSSFLPEIETEDDAKNASLNLMQEQMNRIAVTVNIDSERVTPTYAVKYLSERIDRLNRDVNERDRDLYERILVNTLGDTIRKKINYVQRWQKEMNKFMEHENLIKFRLSWKPKKRESDDQLDTLKLVDALKRDSQWIDVNEISSHFRSKIKIARRRYERQEHKEYNLRDIMREELDYRKWFEFEIFFTKKNDQEKKLTRKTYGELSGGQKDLAMITPVLAALYAKYSEAKEDCPRLFTLDEAFSRVDEENINIMFDYIRKLNFNYILNSQSLWGCYASVPSLNIYELSRPDNRPYVLVDAYYWNGHKKTRIESEESGGF